METNNKLCYFLNVLGILTVLSLIDRTLNLRLPFQQCQTFSILYGDNCAGYSRCAHIVGSFFTCVCLPGYIGSPPYCRHECESHDGCGSLQSCRNFRCVDTCTDACGVKADCNVLRHMPVCSCPRNMDGDPFTHCRAFGARLHDKVVMCYVSSLAAYRPAPGTFTLADIDPMLCTHLVYSFAVLDEATGGIKSPEEMQDLEKDSGKTEFTYIEQLKQRYPHLTVAIAVGDWNEDSLKYYKMAEENRTEFIESVKLFLEKYKFDGVSLDWDYPARQDERPMDQENYASLVKELRQEFPRRRFFLAATLRVGPDLAGQGEREAAAARNFTQLESYLDLVHIVSYDYNRTWDYVVGANAPLASEDEEDELSVENTIKFMLSHNMSKSKLVLELPMYGRNFILQDPDTEEVVFGQTPVKAQGFKGPFTREAGFMGYNEICLKLANGSSSWSQHWHEPSSTPYLRNGDNVLSYDNARSIAAKVKMAMKYHLGGVMASIDRDDFKGACSGQEQDAYIDFEQRYKEIVDKWPVLPVALENLKPLNDDAKYYSSSGGKLHLRLPESKHRNYNLLRTINNVVALAYEERALLEQIDNIESKIKDIDTKHTKAHYIFCAKDGSRVASSLMLVLCAIAAVVSCVGHC